MGKISKGGKTGPAFSYGEKGLRLARTWETFLILTEAAQPLTAAEIHAAVHRRYPFAELPCSIQTTRQDLRALILCGFPIEAARPDGSPAFAGGADGKGDVEPGEGRGRWKNLRWSLRRAGAIAPLVAAPHRAPSAADALALSLSRALLADEFVPLHFPLQRVLRTLLDSLQHRLNEALRRGRVNLREVLGRIRALGPEYVGPDVDGESLVALGDAIARRQIVEAHYENREGGSTEAAFLPLAVWVDEGRPYLLAAGARDAKPRVWRLDRLSGVRAVGPAPEAPASVAPASRVQTAGRQDACPTSTASDVAHASRMQDSPSFDFTDVQIEALLHASFKGWISEPVEITLRAAPEVAYLFREYQYHPSQQIEPQPDGSLTVRLTAPLGWTLEEWILGFGEWVVVLAPEELRAAIKERFEKSLSRYK